MDYLRSLLREGEAAVEPDSFVLVTPRDQSSKYVVFLVLERGSSHPSFVAKVARLPEYGDRLVREGEILAAVQRARVGGYDTVPRVVALGERDGHAALVQTALVGRAIDPATVRRRRAESVAAVLEWLEELPTFPNAGAVEPAWFERLVETPLQRLAEALAADGEALALVDTTRTLLEPLRDAHIPLVLEHGDVSHPNLIRLRDGRVGVVDWELAELRGVPAQDLFFFLAYAAFAARRAWGPKLQLRVFDEAFFRPESWAHRPALDYARAVGVPPAFLGPLFLACWARQTAGLVRKIEGLPLRAPDDEPAPRRLRRALTVYIQRNAYYGLWRHAVAHRERLAWWATGVRPTL